MYSTVLVTNKNSARRLAEWPLGPGYDVTSAKASPRPKLNRRRDTTRHDATRHDTTFPVTPLPLHLATMSHPHPYYPPTLVLPSYAAPVYALPTLLGIFAGIGGLVLLLAWQLMSYLNPTLTPRSKLTASWFLFCGLLHIHFEGYFVKYRRTLAGRSDLVAELWKEYAQSDSRYLTQDSFVVGIEALTVVRVSATRYWWGGGC